MSHEPIARLPVWSPDGESLAHLAASLLKGVIAVAAADGSGVTSTVACPRQRCDPTDWSHDGRWLLVTVYEERDQDVWMLPARGDETARPLLVQPFREREARLSPDGRLVAYVSEESGRPEVSLQTIGAPPRREVISVGGGDQPVWSRNGRVLSFVEPQGLLRSAPVSVSMDRRPVFGAAVLLNVARIGFGHGGAGYDVSPDGGRLYFMDRRQDPAPSDFGVVVGWRELLK